MKKYFLFGLGLIVGAILGVQLGGYLLTSDQGDIKIRQRLVEKEFASAEATRNAGLAPLIKDAVRQARYELDTGGKIGSQTIQTFIDLSESFEPYRLTEADSLTIDVYSPERGILLLSILNLSLDSQALKFIKQKGNFTQMELSNSALESLDFSDMNMSGSRFTNSDLTDASLDSVICEDCLFWGAQMHVATFEYSNFERSNFEWASLDESQGNHSVFDGASFENANFRSAKLSHASFEWVDMKGSSCENVKLDHASLKGADLGKANFAGSSLRNADLSRTIFNQCNLTGCDFTNALVKEDNWLEEISKSEIVGLEVIQEEYNLEPDSAQPSKFRLIK